MNIQYERSTDTMDVSLGSVSQSGPDDEFANGLSGLGGSSSNSRRKPRQPSSKTVQTYDWDIDRVTRLMVKPNVGPSTPVASRITMVYESRFFKVSSTKIGFRTGDRVGNRFLNDELVRDLWT